MQPLPSTCSSCSNPLESLWGIDSLTCPKCNSMMCQLCQFQALERGRLQAEVSGVAGSTGSAAVEVDLFCPNAACGAPLGTGVKAPKAVKEDGCSQCGSAGKPKLQLCRGCLSAYYCSKECQQQDWKSHKVMCQLAQHGPQHTSMMPESD